MNLEMEKLFVDKYIIKNRRKRILYELCKHGKRLDAISRFCHNCDMYIDERKILYRGKDITDNMYIKKYGGAKEGYLICWDPECDMKHISVNLAIPMIRADGMCMIFISENICIVSTEQVQGAKEIVVLTCNK